LSQARIFTRSDRLETKTKRCPEKGSACSTASTMARSPSIDFRMSIGAVAMKMRTARGMVSTG
jgi:hypothetical protein